MEKKENDLIFKDEKELQIFIGKKLMGEGFNVFFDKKICNDVPTFHGDREKPDILVFGNEIIISHKTFKLNFPIAIEVKESIKNNFSNITHSVLQIKKYFMKEYHTNEWNGKIKSFALASSNSIIDENIYCLNSASKRENKMIDWTIQRVLWSISNFAGILKFDGNFFYIEYPMTYPSIKFYFKSGNLIEGGVYGYKYR